MTALPQHAPCAATDRCAVSGRLPVRATLAVLLLTTALSGCQSTFLTPTSHIRDRMLSLSDDKPEEKADRKDKPAFEDEVADDRPDADLRNIDDVVGPLQRVAMSQQQASRPVAAIDQEARRKLETARDLLDKKKYEAAVTAYETLIKERTPKSFNLFKSFKSKKDSRKYDPVREEAMFYLAEAFFMQNHLPKAAGQYQGLIKDYPSTRYMDESTRRLFDIARRWLGTEDFATASEIRQVSLEDETEYERLSTVDPEKGGFRLPNFTDKSRPVFDTTGHAVLALKTIWLNDPSGPLADDALMLAATHHLRAENYREADRLLTILREQFPKSTHLQTAFVIGSHVKLMSYQGAAYDEQALDDALQLKENTLRLFPDVVESDRIRRDIQKITEAKARREWARAEFWAKKRKPKAVAIHCREILKTYPETSVAELARRKLAELDEHPGGDSIQPPETDVGHSEYPGPAGNDGTMSPFRSEPDEPETPQFEDGPVFEQKVPYFDDDSSPQAGRSGDVGRARL